MDPSIDTALPAAHPCRRILIRAQVVDARIRRRAVGPHPHPAAGPLIFSGAIVGQRAGALKGACAAQGAVPAGEGYVAGLEGGWMHATTGLASGGGAMLWQSAAGEGAYAAREASPAVEIRTMCGLGRGRDACNDSIARRRLLKEKVTGITS